MRRKGIHIIVGPTFYKKLEQRRQNFQRRIGFRENITQTNFTEMLARSGKLNFPKINKGLLKNVRKKS